MSPIEGLSARVVVDLFDGLPPTEREVFLKLLGPRIGGDELVAINEAMPVQERKKYADGLTGEMMRIMFPIFAKTAAEMQIAHPLATKDELGQKVLQEAARQFHGYTEAITELEAARLKDERDRKSDPETVRRNIKICDLRKQNPKTWSYGRLAKEFGVTKRYIGKVIAEEAKWRREAARGGLTS